jgi:ABC-type uncharacterized transport system fused permease/ATPase subunit
LKHNKLLLIFLSFILLGEAIFTGLLPVSRGHLFSLLSSKLPGIWIALLLYFLTYFAIDFFQSFKGYMVLKVSLWYREIRTSSIVEHIKFRDNSREPEDYLWSLKHCLPSNTPQRIQEDIKLSYWSRIEVWCEYIVSTVILMQLFLLNLSEPTLIICALIYASVSVFIALKFNPRLTTAEISSQQAEACFRTSLVASITDIGLLSFVNSTLMKAARIRTEYLLFTKLQLGIVAVLPYAILIPKLMSGSMDLGTLVKHQATFALIVVNAAVLIQMFPKLIQGKASETRVKEII